MKTGKLFLFLISAAIVLPLLGSCGENRESNRSVELVLHGLGDDHWSYFSIESGEIVGTGKYPDAEEDAVWAARNDWDFAICGNLIKTNSGTSGNALGGIQINTSSTFDALAEAPEDGYIVDTLFLVK